MSDTENTIGIENAAWWLNHSHVLIREDFTADDQEWVANQGTRVVNPGTQFARIEANLGSENRLLVQRMVVEGVVAVKRANDRIKTVNLPKDVSQLLAQDLNYIVAQIQKYNAPMSEEQQADFLPDASVPSVMS